MSSGLNRATYRILTVPALRERFALDGVVWDAGALALARVPQAEATLIEGGAPAGALAGPFGIGVDAHGNLYVADPANHRVLRWDACTGEAEPLACLAAGSLPGQLNTPRGVIVGPRGALYIADSGNHRVLVVGLHTGQLRGVWGQPDYAAPQPGTEPGRFDTPWDLAADADGFIYVSEAGNQRVQKFDADGQVIPTFWDTMQAAATVPAQPEYLTVAVLDGDARLLILDNDGGTPRVLAYTLDGTFDTALTAFWADLLAGVSEAAGIVFDGTALYIGDAARERVLAFALDGTLSGTVRGYSGPVSGLALDSEGRLLVHTGSAGGVTRLLPGEAYRETGQFLAGPFSIGNLSVRWDRLRLAMPPLAPETHIQLYTLTAETADPPPAIPADLRFEANLTALTPLNTWRAAPPDAADLLVLNAPGTYLWIGARLQSDGRATPQIDYIRADANTAGWLRDLPAIYRAESNGPLLQRMLALFESVLDDEEALIDGLPALFDPGAAPDDASGEAWLDWLAGWLAFELDETWGEPQRRAALAGAFALYRRQGTVAALRQFLALYTGATVHITEPARHAHIWSLGTTSTLGFNTMLAAAEAQGAVVGTTATLNRSHLIADEDFGAPLFEDIAHHFIVEIHSAGLDDPQATVARVRAVLEREKPAHTTYSVCLVEPKLRVGYQARIGRDTIVGGPIKGMTGGAPRVLGTDTVIDRDPDAASSGGALGDARLGRGSRMT